MSETLAQSWKGLINDAIAFRHELHRHPELTWSEYQTASRIRQRLSQLGIEWQACAETGTIARIASQAKGRHIALRGDIDALPIVEESGVEWTSKEAGCMHACGHDGHTATLFAAAQWLKLHEENLPGPVTLLFQPAEEGGYGAKKMIEDGALAGIDAIFGWHNWPAISFGQAVCPEGAVMAGNGLIDITVHGLGGHSSQPELCCDPVLAASGIIVALQQIVSRRLPPQAAAVVSITSFDAPSGPTIVPDKAKLSGSYRIADPTHLDKLIQLIKEISHSVATAHNTHCDVEISPRYPPTLNHSAEAELYRNALQKEFGSDAISTTTLLPIMASEDFSYYLNEIPGAFALIGSSRDPQNSPPCHSAKYDFNDELIAHVTRIYARLVGAPLP
ncbi:N(2)-acetyl-L-2,4-diaminobutanoate deacetylase DoeB2 [Porticoccaceae bacterium LTM1]|nr:N(2)-acetyl-L-2,4-diaminobutanoate deacetylase DoeB2 [Porticoccaceae bacterium LTM1]